MGNIHHETIVGENNAEHYYANFTSTLFGLYRQKSNEGLSSLQAETLFALVDKLIESEENLLKLSLVNDRTFLHPDRETLVRLLDQIRSLQSVEQQAGFDPKDIVFDEKNLSISILPHLVSVLPYESKKSRTLAPADRLMIQNFIERYSNIGYLQLEKGIFNIADWHTRMSVEDFHGVVSLVGSCWDLVVVPVSTDLGFSFGIDVRHVIPVQDRQESDYQGETVFHISEVWFPEIYTGQQVYDSLVTEEWNKKNLLDYFGIQPKSYESYEY